MTLTGGKRKVNKSLKDWVAFVKKVQREEKLSYKDAIHRAKVRKDKGEKWMMGGSPLEEDKNPMGEVAMEGEPMDVDETFSPVDETASPMSVDQNGGRRRRRTMRRSRGRGRARTARKGRSRASRRR